MAKAERKTLPKPVLHKTIFQARYKPQLEFYNLMTAAAQQFGEFPHWQTDRLKITLFDFEKRCSVGIAHDSFSYSQDSHDTNQEGLHINQVVDILPTALHVESFIRFGLRRWYLIPIDVPFESVASILNIKLFSQDERLRGIMPRELNDMSYIAVCADPPYGSRTVIGPMRKVEIPSYIVVDQAHHLNMENRAELYVDIVKGYPDVSVYIEIDFYQQSEGLTVEDARSFIQTASDKVHRVVADLRDYFFSTKLEE